MTNPFNEIADVSKNTLSGTFLNLMGFCYVPHPEKGRRWRMQLCVYNVVGTDRYPITVSEVHKRDVDPKAMKFGGNVPAEVLLAYVQREVAGGTWDETKAVLREAMHEYKWTMKGG